MGVSDQHHAPVALPPGNRDSTHSVGSWVGPRADVGAEKLSFTGIRSPDRPAHCESLYRLSYPGTNCGIAGGNSFKALSKVRYLGHGSS
jgi:hypothetical protein